MWGVLYISLFTKNVRSWSFFFSTLSAVILQVNHRTQRREKNNQLWWYVTMKSDPYLLWNTEVGRWWFGDVCTTQARGIGPELIAKALHKFRRFTILQFTAEKSEGSQSPDLVSLSHLRCSVHSRRSRNLKDLETFCQEEWSVLSCENKTTRPQLLQKTSRQHWCYRRQFTSIN